MVSFAHIINPVQVNKTSDLYTAQPITLATMGTAKEFSKESVDVNLYAIQFHNEERIPLPQDFIRVPDLTRSIANVKAFKQKRKLPLIKDILDALYESSQAEYYIYTNVDIALMPYFYQVVSTIIEKGYDAFIINRRTIPGKYNIVEEISLMYAEIGELHKGYDCFVFKRDMYPKFKLGTICIGTAWIGRAMLANMAANGAQFREFRHEHLTFHIGDQCPWRNEKFNDYFQENQREYLALFKQIEMEGMKFEHTVRSYLLDTGEKRIIPDFDQYYLREGKCEPYSIRNILSEPHEKGDKK